MKTFIIVLTCLLLFGCKSTPDVVYKERWLTMEEHWLVNCGLIAPPDIDFYNNATDRQRAIVMTRSYTELLKEVAKCNVRLKEARDHNQRMMQRTVSAK